MILKKRTSKANIAALLLTGLLAAAFPGLALAAETPNGTLGDVATFTGQPGEGMQITAKEKDAFKYTVVASYDQDGRMVDFELVPLKEDGTAEISLEKWGKDVKLFAVSETMEPASPQEEWTAAAEASSEEETVWLVTTKFNAMLQEANVLFEPALNDECRISRDGSDVLNNRQWVTSEMYGEMKAAVRNAEESVFTTQAEVDKATNALQEAIDGWNPKYGQIEPFTAEVFGIRRDFVHNYEVVESGTIAVEFDFENYREPVMFALMEHVETPEGEEHNVIVQEIFSRENESDTKGAVTFNMTGIAMGEYEVVYLEDDTWYGTNVYIDMFKEDGGIVQDELDVVELDLSTSDEWRTEGYIYDLVDITFDGAEWAVEEDRFDWSKVTYWVNGDQFIWDENSKPGDFELEVDLMGYSYDPETETGYAQAIIAAYTEKVKQDQTYEVEIHFPAEYLRLRNDNYELEDNETFVVSFEVDVTDSGAVLKPVKDKLDTITIDMGTAADWKTEGYVYDVFDIEFDGAAWRMEPYWEEHVTYWINGEQFQWIPGESVVGDYALEVDMVPEYDDETGVMSMQAMVFAYADNVEDNDSFEVEIRIPTYCLERTDDNYRITRDDTAVIDFTVNIDNCDAYVPPVVDRVDDIYIDLSASDEWKTEGYLYQMFDITFNAAEWAAEEMDWGNVTYWVNGEQFEWIVEGENPSQPGDFAVEADIFDYYYDAESQTGYASGLIAAYVDNVAVDEVYEVEMQFPSNHLRVTDDSYVIKSGDTFAVSFDVYIVDSEEELTPAKDTLEEITINVAEADDWLTEGYVYVEKEITFDGARWIREPYWEEHVTYWINGKQFQWIPGESVVGDYAVEVDMVPDWDEQGNMTMKAMVFAYVKNVKDGNSFNMEIKVPTYSLERTDDNHRITRDETAVIDFTVNIEGCEGYVAPVADTVEDVYIDLSASDEWKTEGYLYQMFDITFNAAEWAAEEIDWDNVTYWVNGEQFEWIVDGENPSQPGDFAVEADIFDYYYDAESQTGYASGLIAAYVDNVAVDEVYAVEMQFPSNHLRVTDDDYAIKSGDTFTVSFDVYIVDSEEELTPAKDCLESVEIDLASIEDDATEGWVYTTIALPFDGAAWRFGPNPAHVTYWVNGQLMEENGPLEVELVEGQDDEGRFVMKAELVVNGGETGAAKAGDSFDVEIEVPTYCLERTEDNYRITRNETSVIDFKVNLIDSGEEEPSVDTNIILTQSGTQVFASWDDYGCDRYTWGFLDSNGKIKEIQWTDGNECSTWDIVVLIPHVESGTETFDFAVYEFDKDAEDAIGRKLALLENAITATSSGEALKYTMDFTAPENGIYSITLEEKPKDGDVFLNMWRRTDGQRYSSDYYSDGSQTYEEKTFMGALKDGDVYDLRKIDYTLADNCLNATMTPRSEVAYQVGGNDEPTDEEKTVDVRLTEDIVVVLPDRSPSVEFSFKNLTEATTVSTYVVKTKGASEAAAIECKTQDVSAGTKYTTVGLYSATFNEVGTYYVYYKVGNDVWCDTPLEITVKQPENAKVYLKASYIVGTAGEAISKDVEITLENDTFKNTMVAGTDVTDWFTNMPADWTATVKRSAASGALKMTVTIACAADKTVAGAGEDGPDGFAGLTVPAEYLTGGNALTATETFAYKVN